MQPIRPLEVYQLKQQQKPGKMKACKYLSLFICMAILFTGCTTRKHELLRIALSSSTSNYEKWIHRVDSTVIAIDFNKMPIGSAVKLLETCDGL